MNQPPASGVPATAPATRDYFAEMYVAGILADAGWNVYFPRRDQGFDFIITKPVSGSILVRPVQVKGKYPTRDKTAKSRYGYRGKLTALHPEMVLAMPFFGMDPHAAPLFTIYLPAGQLSPWGSRTGQFRVEPALYRDGQASVRPHYRRFCDAEGVALLEADDWPVQSPGI
jgi:hypothetical protein